MSEFKYITHDKINTIKDLFMPVIIILRVWFSEGGGPGDFTIQGATDGNSNFRIQGATDGHSNFQIQGPSDGGAATFNVQPPVHNQPIIQRAYDANQGAYDANQGTYNANQVNAKALEYNDPSGIILPELFHKLYYILFDVHKINLT